MELVTIYTDGGTAPDYCRAAWVRVDGNPEPVEKVIELPIGLTNNEAEYYGLIHALKDNPDKKIKVLADSQLLIYQVTGKYRLNETRLKVLCSQVHELMKGREVHLYWCRRESNKAGILLEDMRKRQRNGEAMYFRGTNIEEVMTQYQQKMQEFIDKSIKINIIKVEMMVVAENGSS